MNLPNWLTLARIALAPLLAVAIQAEAETSVAALVFAAGMASDFADGYLARSRAMITRFGKLMDPIADKVFVGTAFACLALTNRMAWWVVAVVFARELLVTAMRLVARREGVIIAANSLGKAKTVVQAIVVFAVLLAGSSAPLTQALILGMVAVTLVSGAVYVHGYLRGRRPALPAMDPTRSMGSRATLG